MEKLVDELNQKSFLVFGSNGEIGQAVVRRLESEGQVLRGSRNLDELKAEAISSVKFDGVIWAQGLNFADSIYSPELDAGPTLSANVAFVINSLRILLASNSVATGAQLLVVGSIWGQLARPDKLTYTISKAAVLGLVKSLAVDLASFNIQVNSVSPGPIDTQMTRTNLTSAQLDRIVSETPLKRLVSLEEVVEVICTFISGKLSGVTGQDLVIDGGWGVSKLV